MHHMHGTCHSHGHAGAGHCGPASTGRFRRHFISPEEEKEMLQRYIDDLKHELSGAEERLKNLQ